MAHDATGRRGARGGRAKPVAMRLWARHLSDSRERTVLERPSDAHRRRALGAAAAQGGPLRDRRQWPGARGARPASRGRRSSDGRGRRSATRSAESLSTTSGRRRSSRRRSTRRGRARERAPGSATRVWRGRRSTARSWRWTRRLPSTSRANPAGAALWRSSPAARRARRLVAELMREYEIDSDTASADTDAFLATCASADCSTADAAAARPADAARGVVDRTGRCGTGGVRTSATARTSRRRADPCRRRGCRPMPSAAWHAVLRRRAGDAASSARSSLQRWRPRTADARDIVIGSTGPADFPRMPGSTATRRRTRFTRATSGSRRRSHLCTTSLTPLELATGTRPRRRPRAALRRPRPATPRGLRARDPAGASTLAVPGELLGRARLRPRCSTLATAIARREGLPPPGSRHPACPRRRRERRVRVAGERRRPPRPRRLGAPRDARRARRDRARRDGASCARTACSGRATCTSTCRCSTRARRLAPDRHRRRRAVLRLRGRAVAAPARVRLGAADALRRTVLAPGREPGRPSTWLDARRRAGRARGRGARSPTRPPREPRGVRDRMAWLAACAISTSARAIAGVAADDDVELLVHPLIDGGSVDRRARARGGFADRTAGMTALFSGVLPPTCSRGARRRASTPRSSTVTAASSRPHVGRATGAPAGSGGHATRCAPTGAASARPHRRSRSCRRYGWRAMASSNRSTPSPTEPSPAGGAGRERQGGVREQRLGPRRLDPHTAVRDERRRAARHRATGSTTTASPHASDTQPRNGSSAAHGVERHAPALAHADRAERLADAEPLGGLGAQVDRARPGQRGGPSSDEQRRRTRPDDRAPPATRAWCSCPPPCRPERPHAVAGHERAAVEALPPSQRAAISATGAR